MWFTLEGTEVDVRGCCQHVKGYLSQRAPPLHTTRPSLTPLAPSKPSQKWEKLLLQRWKTSAQQRWKTSAQQMEMDFFSLLSPPYKLWQRSVLILETADSRGPSAVEGPCMGCVIPCQPETTSLCLEPALRAFGQISTVPFLLIHLPQGIFHKLHLQEKRRKDDLQRQIFTQPLELGTSTAQGAEVLSGSTKLVGVLFVSTSKLGVFWCKPNSSGYMNTPCIQVWSWGIKVSGIWRTLCTSWMVAFVICPIPWHSQVRWRSLQHSKSKVMLRATQTVCQ